jgi:hypothetical protein
MLLQQHLDDDVAPKCYIHLSSFLFTIMADQHSPKTAEARHFGVFPDVNEEQSKNLRKYVKDVSKFKNEATKILGFVEVGMVIDPKTNEIISENCSHPEMKQVVAAFKLYMKMNTNLITKNVNKAIQEVSGNTPSFTEVTSDNTVVLRKKKGLKASFF